MVQRLYSELSTAERDAFEAACARHGFIREDFDIVENTPASPPASRGGNGVTREIVVQRVIGAGIGLYPARDDASWVEAFERDLERDGFGFPLAD